MSTITPINRHTELVVESDGTRAYKVYNKMSPHYYMDKTGSLNSIDITNLQTITKGTVGEIKLREKNIASIGFRTDGNKTKYLGMRPDETQEDGTHQLEWTVDEAIINNTTQSITLNQTNMVNGVTTDMGGTVVKSSRFSTKQMVPVSGNISNFQVKYTLHLTGLQISNSKYTENTTVRNNISGSGTITTGTSHYVPDNGYFKVIDSDNKVKFMISLPVLLDSDFKEVTNDTVHTLKDNGDGTYEYIKYPSDNLLSSGISSSVRYIDAETIYADAALDGYRAAVSFVALNGNQSTWDTLHDNTGGFFGSATVHHFDAVGTAGNTSGWATLNRSFFSFDTSEISDVSSGDFKVYTDTDLDSDLIAIEATHTEIATSTYNDFTGWEAGWDGDAGDTSIVPYSGEVEPTDDDYNTLELTSAALTHIADEGTTQICLMDYDYDYLDVVPPTDQGNHLRTKIWFSDEEGTSKDPYLYLVVPAAVVVPPRLKLSSGKLKVLGGKVLIN